MLKKIHQNVFICFYLCSPLNGMTGFRAFPTGGAKTWTELVVFTLQQLLVGGWLHAICLFSYLLLLACQANDCNQCSSHTPLLLCCLFLYYCLLHIGEFSFTGALHKITTDTSINNFEM